MNQASMADSPHMEERKHEGEDREECQGQVVWSPEIPDEDGKSDPQSSGKPL